MRLRMYGKEPEFTKLGLIDNKIVTRLDIVRADNGIPTVYLYDYTENSNFKPIKGVANVSWPTSLYSLVIPPIFFPSSESLSIKKLLGLDRFGELEVNYDIYYISERKSFKTTVVHHERSKTNRDFSTVNYAVVKPYTAVSGAYREVRHKIRVYGFPIAD